jgi:hypothetical protein
MRHEDWINYTEYWTSPAYSSSKPKIKIKYKPRHSYLLFCISHTVFQKTIWCIQLDIFFNYESFPSRLIILLNDFSLTPKVLDNDFNTILILCMHPALILCPSCIPEKVSINKKNIPIRNIMDLHNRMQQAKGRWTENKLKWRKLTRGDKANRWKTGAGCIIFLYTHLTCV